MSEMRGEEVHGSVHGTDNTTTAIPLYKFGTVTARTLGATERLVVTAVSMITAPGGDMTLFFDADGDGNIDAGETVERGTFAVSGGIVTSYHGSPHAGPMGIGLKVKPPNGVWDVQIKGFILKT